MMPLFGWLLFYVSAAFALTVILIVLLFKWSYGYWERRGVPFVEPESIFGTSRDILLATKSAGLAVQRMYQQLEPHSYGGIFISIRPQLLIRDPDIIKMILVKDFAHFQHRGIKEDEKHDPLSTHLFNLSGPRWRALRTKLTPTFTSGKMKLMYPLMEECSQQLLAALQPLAARGEAVEMKDWNARYTTDVIGTCAFGINCNSITNPNSEFREMGRNVLNSPIRTIFNFVLVRAGKLLRIKLIHPKYEQFFMDIVRQTVDYRKTNNVTRNDFVNLLLQLKEKGHVDDDHGEATKHQSTDFNFEFTDGLFAAQCFVFFVAGYETSSTTMSFCIYELAVNPDVQDRLRAEVDGVLKKHGGKITYDALHDMTYLDMVISETLRKYPPVADLTRICTIPYKIPDSNLKIEEGTKVIIPVYALHHDPKYYPDPEKFIPERFTEDEKATRHHFVYLPFGEGPRICIGMRFGLIQTKLGVASLVSKFVFSPTAQTPAKLELDPKTAVTSSVGGIHVRIAARAS